MLSGPVFHTGRGSELQLRTLSTILGTGEREKHPHTDPQKKNIMVRDNSAVPVLEFATKRRYFSHN